MKRDLISIRDLENKELVQLLELTAKLKARPKKAHDRLKGKALGLIFQKPSNRTRVSFEAGMHQLGGYAIYLGPDDIKLGVREEPKDIARTLSRYLDAIVARTFAHKDIIDLAKSATIPVINGLSDLFHPCQGLADIFTVKERYGRLKGIRLAFIGDGNNVLHSLLYGAVKTGMNISVATPKGYDPDSTVVADARELAKVTGSLIEITNDKYKVAERADVLYTDVWASMGQEDERAERLKDFQGFQIDAELLKKANPRCIVMHCLPAHRGEEITDEVIDGPHSVVFDQAENRLHIQKAILLKLLA